jgi:hypothetical protein
MVMSWMVTRHSGFWVGGLVDEKGAVVPLMALCQLFLGRSGTGGFADDPSSRTLDRSGDTWQVQHRDCLSVLYGGGLSVPLFDSWGVLSGEKLSRGGVLAITPYRPLPLKT